MRRIRLTLMSGALTAMILLTACTGGDPEPTGDPVDQTLTIGATLEPPTLDPTGSDAASIPQALLYNVYQTLVKIDANGETQPLLAKEYEVSPDRTRYTFTLADARFPGGRAVSSADVKYSIDKVKTGQNKAAAAAQSVVKEVATPDEKTVVVTLSQPSNSWLYAITSTAGMVFDSTSTADLATATAGSGPFQLDQFTKGSDLRLKPNEDFAGRANPFASVTFRYYTDPNAMNSAMLADQLDIISNLQVPQALPQFENDRFTVISGTTNGEVVMSLNHESKPLSDVRVRRAINYAIDRKALLETVWNDQGTLIGSMVPPTDPWYVDLSDTYPHDPAKAKKLLKEAGYGDGLKLRMRLPVIPYATASGQFVASQLKDVGITATIDELDFPRWLDLVFTKADYDISIVAHVEARDMGRFADPKYYFRYHNPAYDRLLAEADAGTPEEQVATLKEASRLLAEDAAADWLFLLPNLVITSRDVQGVAENATTLSFDLTHITKE